MSTETVSSLFPGRPIRPLPKRRLRERLSPEVADSITYPPVPQTTTPLFTYPYGVRDDIVTSPGAESAREGRAAEREGQHASRRNGVGFDSDEDRTVPRRNGVGQQTTTVQGARSSRVPPKPDHSVRSNRQAPVSAASSVDGYDTFENTNNKKKRKIPSAGDGSLNGLHGLSDLGSLSGSLAGTAASHDSDGQGVASLAYGAATQGISGPGRGRYGRVRNGRSPLRALSDSNSIWLGRNGKPRSFQWSQSNENSGIISNAIANAEKLPSLAGQENISLLHQQQAAKGRPASAQFTFTCDSQVPGTLSWPGSNMKPMPYSSHQSNAPGPTDYIPVAQDGRRHTQGTQTGIMLQPQGNVGVPTGNERTSESTSHKGGRKKKGRRYAKYIQQANQRRLQTEEKNRSHPPKEEDMWICEYCEYERIFGEPPRALILQYEMKEEEARRKEEERRRLFEKAKNRLRKGKKGKLPAKNSASPPAGAHKPHEDDPHDPHDPRSAAMDPNNSQGTHSEEYYDEEEFVNDEFDQESQPEDIPELTTHIPGNPGGLSKPPPVVGLNASVTARSEGNR